MRVIKRNGQEVEFDKQKIVDAMTNAFLETEEGLDEDLIQEIADEIEEEVEELEYYPTVETIQDMVEEALMSSDRKDVAKRYILYRDERTVARNNKKNKYEYLDSDFLSFYKHKEDPFPNELGKFVYYRTYSRPIPSEQRRERWYETVARVVDFNIGLQVDAMRKQGKHITESVMSQLKTEAKEIYDAMYNLKLFPSGRTLWVGNTTPSKVFPLSNFNCSFLTIDSFIKFSEMFFVLMLGTGVGLSVTKEHVDKLPKVNTKIDIIHKDYILKKPSDRIEHTELRVLSKSVLEIVVGDSKSGWSKAIEFYFDIITSKQYADIEFILMNYDNIRPAGERLKTFGGFASGHNAIKIMFEKIQDIFRTKANPNSQWYKVTSINCLDIATNIAENVVSGGTRRSALIVFCDKDDYEVREAKSNLYYQDENGQWIANEKMLNRMLSNNTILYDKKPSRQELKEHFELLKVTGEPSFGNLEEMKRRREDVQGGNPCFEILLKDRGVCNLTEVNMFAFINSDGTYDKEAMINAQRLSAKMGYRMATIELELHTWDLVNREDRLTGCSLTGVMDFVNATKMSNEELGELLAELKDVAIEESNKLADFLGMNRPKLVTCNKPSGTISQLPVVSSGVHFSHSPYYIRRVRVSSNDPLAKVMCESGFKWSPEVGQTEDNHSIKVFEFPVKAPEGKTKYDVSAIEQLELYKLIMKTYVQHNASNTIHVRPNEWDEVEQWVWDNWDDIVGVTFLSLDDSFYQLLPYEAITKEQYETMIAEMPKMNLALLKKYETFEEFELMESDCTSNGCPVK